MVSILTNIETAVGALTVDRTSPITIGPWVLYGEEIPEAPILGGRQEMVVHRLIGGDKRIDILGDQPDQLQLSGKLFGPTCAARSAQMEAARNAGQALTFSLYGQQIKGVISNYSATFGPNTSYCAYTITFEISATTAATVSTSSLNTLLGSDVSSALGAVSSAASSAASILGTVTSQASAIVGQVTPIASMLGVGGALTKVDSALGAAQTATGSLTEIASAPAALASFTGNISTAASNLGDVVTTTGANMLGITPSNGASLTTSLANTAVHANALVATGYAGRTAGATQ